MAWRLVQYRGAYDAFIAECDEGLRDAIAQRLTMVALRGSSARFPLTESFGDGLFEIRAKSARVHARLLFGFVPVQQIVIVWAGFKDQRRLPPETIRLARRLLEEAEAHLEGFGDVQIH